MAVKVYLLESGCYEDRHVVGVYATPEAAMAAHRPTRISDPFPEEQAGRTYEWRDSGGGSWAFDADWDHNATVDEYVVEGPIADVDRLCEICLGEGRG